MGQTPKPRKDKPTQSEFIPRRTALLPKSLDDPIDRLVELRLLLGVGVGEEGELRGRADQRPGGHADQADGLEIPAAQALKISFDIFQRRSVRSVGSSSVRERVIV